MDINIRPVDCAFDIWIKHMSYTQFALDHIGAGSDYHAYKHEAEIWGKSVVSEQSYNNQVQELKDCLADCRKCEQLDIDCLPVKLEPMPLKELEGFPS